MATVRPVLWKQKEKDGEHPIYIRIEARNRRRYISTGEWIKPRHWNPARREVRKSHPLYETLNALIDKRVNEARAAIHRLKLSDEDVTPRAIKEALQPLPASKADFLAFGRAYADELYSLGKIPTGRRYRSILRKLEAFAGSSLPFSDVTAKFVRSYELHMVEKLGNGPSTVASNLRAIKSLVNRAIKEGLIDGDDSPFADIQVKEPPGEKRKLSTEEIAAIRALTLAPHTPLWDIRNAWLFSLYCGGIRFRDVATLRVGNVRGGRLAYQMSKTGRYKNLDLPPVAQAIVDLYVTEDSSPDDRVFSILDGYDLSTAEKFDRSVQSRNSYCNRLLKKIAAAAAVNPKLSFHMSRHSFANVALAEGWSVRKIQAALGHREISVTERYLRELDAEFSGDEMGRLFGQISG